MVIFQKTPDQVLHGATGKYNWLVSIENEDGHHICGGNLVLMKLGYNITVREAIIRENKFFFVKLL